MSGVLSAIIPTNGDAVFAAFSGLTTVIVSHLLTYTFVRGVLPDAVEGVLEIHRSDVFSAFLHGALMGGLTMITARVINALTSNSFAA